MNYFDNIQLNLIKDKIIEHAFIKEAKDFIINEEVNFNPLVIKKNIKETSEALKILKDNNIINFDGIYDVNDILDKADKDITLNGIELKNVLVFHNHCARIKKQFESFNESYTIRDYSDSIMINNDVFNRIENCIDNSGEVKRDASDKLKEIYNQLDKCEIDLYNKAYSFIDKHSNSLQETSIYTRNDRIVFLIKNSDKNKYNGYTYGSSSSGLASYVEPASLIEENNKKVQLLQDKNDEIDRILKQLTYLISSICDEYRNNFESLIKLSVIFAKANYGYLNNGIIAEINDTRYFDFVDLCHPLIDQNKVVSNSYRIYEPYQGIVISGSNTGGKTVSLKAIGLSIIMTYLGIPIIASSASVPLYKNVYVDIDDNQSIVDSLSTFSAHITNINDILNNADRNCLILIDELISGTDPSQAQAISLAILDKIKELGSIFVITTHFDDIKKYSYDDENILLSSVGFNMETLSPTYKYLEDSIGSSNAIEIASRYFDDNSIIENAKYYLNKSKDEKDQLLEKLAKQIEENELEKEKLLNMQNNFNSLTKIYEDKLSEFEANKDSLKQKYINELNEYVLDIKEKAIDKLESIKEVENKNIINEIEELIDIKQEEDEEIVFNIGDNVRIKDNEQIGIITDLNNDLATINIKGLTVKTNIKDLKLMPKTIKNDTKVISKQYKRVKNELNIVGERVEDGLVLMEEYLDKANAAHMSQVKIIHGIGTGALRSALRERLKKLSYVKEFKDGDYYDGGSAVTMVEFKQ